MTLRILINIDVLAALVQNTVDVKGKKVLDTIVTIKNVY